MEYNTLFGEYLEKYKKMRYNTIVCYKEKGNEKRKRNSGYSINICKKW